MKNSIYPLLIFVLLLAHPSYAKNASDPCTEKQGGAMAAGLCIKKSLKQADDELNKAYKGAIARIKEEQKYLSSGSDLEKTFRASQRAWLKYRDSYCEFEGMSTGAAGGWMGVHTSQCILDMTRERTQYLKNVFYG